MVFIGKRSGTGASVAIIVNFMYLNIVLNLRYVTFHCSVQLSCRTASVLQVFLRIQM